MRIFQLLSPITTAERAHESLTIFFCYFFFVIIRTKKFLKKQQLRDWLRVVSTSRGVYELKFFNVVDDEADEDDE